MSDGRLDALIGILRPKSKFASNPADVWRAMQVTLSRGVKLSLLLKVAGGQRSGSKHHFTIRYVVAQCCRYQRSVAVVLKNVVFCSERLLYFE